LAAGCTGDFDKINRNPAQATYDELQRENYIIGTNIRGLQNLVVPVQEHRYQFNESLTGNSFAGYMEATPDAWRTKFSTFNPSADWLRWPFVVVMQEVYPYFRGVMNNTEDEVAIALAKIFRVAIMHRVTDTYGPIPYSKVMEDSKESLTVAYDPQEDVYTRMFAELDEALAVLNDNRQLSAEAFRKFDNVYFGDIAKWIRYTNSLKLRMAMRLSYVDEATSKAKAAEAIAAGVIETNADNAMMHAAENRTALIYNDWGDHRVAADIISYMNGFADPRRAVMFTEGVWNKQPGYYGLRVGTDPTNKQTAVDTYSNQIVTGSSPYLWFNAAEATFLRAEWELRWGSVETAQELYGKAIKLSFEERGAAGADAYVTSSAKPAKYIDPMGTYSAAEAPSDITVAWEDGDTDEAKERNLERIITQKWIAIFPLGVEAWSEYRRTGYPRLLPAVENKSGGTVDSRYGYRRLPYPAEEYTENAVNLKAAIQMLGGRDNGGVRVWWDCKPITN
jgi:hypothetical protein